MPIVKNGMVFGVICIELKENTSIEYVKNEQDQLFHIQIPQLGDSKSDSFKIENFHNLR